jgi:hypothetical protein
MGKGPCQFIFWNVYSKGWIRMPIIFTVAWYYNYGLGTFYNERMKAWNAGHTQAEMWAQVEEASKAALLLEAAAAEPADE